MTRLAVVYDKTRRPETTGVYCLRALEQLMASDRIAQVTHVLPDDLLRLTQSGGHWDAIIAIDDGLDYELPTSAGPIAWWAIDTHLDFDRALRRAKQARWTFAAQKNGAERLRLDGIDAIWLPLACDPDLHARHSVQSQFDVSFVGHVNSDERHRLLRLIQENFPKTFVGNRYFREMAAIYSASKIVFNRSLIDDVNMRVFEALCSGSLLVTNSLPENGLSELFREGAHLVTYDTDQDLFEKLDYYLRNDEARRPIADAGRAEVLARHTYRHRMETLFERIELRRPTSISLSDRWIDQVDFVIKTFLRPRALNRLLSSIDQYYPKANVTIVDDGGLDAAEDEDSHSCRLLIDQHPRFRLINMPFDSGVSAGRNRLVAETNRPYLLLLDDDFCFTAETRIEELLARLQSDTSTDIVAGVCFDWNGDQRRRRRSGGILERNGSTLVHATNGWRDQTVGRCDYFPDFALFRRSVFEQVTWRGGVGGEHYDFCLQIQERGFGVAQLESVSIDHYPETASLPGYVERRFNFQTSQQEFLARWKLDSIIQDGAVILQRQISASDRLPQKSGTYFEHVRPDVQELVPVTARKILDLGCGAGRLGQALKDRQPASVTGVEFNPDAAEIARASLDIVHVANLERDALDFDEGQFDCVICADILEHLRQPEIVLSRIRRWLMPSGTLVISLPNVRNHTVIRSLLAGNWTYESAGLLDADHVRFFTRRELEKLLFRSGFDIDELKMVPGEGFEEWVSQGRPREISHDGFQIRAASTDEAAEFFAYQYLVRAIPQIGSGISKPTHSSPNGMEQLAERCPWPVSQPVISTPNDHQGWFADGAREVLTQSVTSDMRLIVELGSWLGLSTRFLADRAPNAKIIAIDHWKGSPEHHSRSDWNELLPRLYETFLARNWDYRDRIQPLRFSTIDGLKMISEAGLEPDLIFVDADHAYSAVKSDLQACRKLFPRAVLTGDDYDDSGVQRAVHEVAEIDGLRLESFGQSWRGWRLSPPVLSRQGLIRSAAPDSFGLTSIIIVTWNQLPYTRICLDSLRLRTDEPYELIVVDNGSTDGTVEYLRNQNDITLIENIENRGFPAAVNQGLRVANGEQLLLLNNDTVLTTGWLRRMLETLNSDAEIGIVGPTTNCAGSEQQVDNVGYSHPNDLDGFAWSLHQRLLTDGVSLVHDTDRLIGFCLLFKREVLDKIGLLDERFGIGCFEDDDYCQRAREAGYRTVIVRHAFIHHYGSVTFQGSGTDLSQVLRENQKLYEQKWSQKASPPSADQSPDSSYSTSLNQVRPAATSQPASSDQSILSTSKPKPRPEFILACDDNDNLIIVPNTIRLSGCLIVRNNAHTIRPCLESLKPWVDEIIVVDTGSTDATPQIAEELGARVYHWQWRDDFAAARNQSLDHARGEWIFWMDSDDTLPEDCGRKLRALVDSLCVEASESRLAGVPVRASNPGSLSTDTSPLGYVMQVHCPGNDPHDVTIVDHVKLFRNLPELRFEFRIHEQILPAIRRADGEVAFTDIYVVHSGSDRTPHGQAGKLERDFKLLHLEMADHPDHPFVLFNLGMTHADCGQHEEAIRFLVRCIEVSGSEESHVRKAYALLISSLMQAQEYERAEQACHEGRQLFPDDKELLFRQAMLEHQLGRLSSAANTYHQLLNASSDRHFTSIDVGLDGFKARHNLALVFEDLNDHTSAMSQWASIIAERPDYVPAWRGLILANCKLGRQAELQHLCDDLRNAPRSVQKLIPYAKGLLHELKGEVDEAVMHLVTADQADPDETTALRENCRILFEHGHWTRACETLERLTERSPLDASAYHNLGVARWRTGDAKRGAASLQKSIQLRPNSIETWELLASLLSDCGYESDAADCRRQIQRLVQSHRSVDHDEGTMPGLVLGANSS